MKTRLLLSIVLVGCVFESLCATPDPNFHCYLLFGQSNMAGGGNTANLITADCDTTPRVKVLAFSDCSGGTSPDCKQYPLTRTHDKWYTAFPPLHICSEGISPGDWFAKTMLDSIRSDITIGLIPCALSGQSIDVFKKGGSGFTIPTWAHPTLGNSSPYSWMLDRCKIAQQTGVIKGFLFHQGESDNGSSTWISRVTAVFDNLKKDLGLDSTLPVIVGELVPGACCTSHNTIVNQFAKQYPHCGLASSQGLKNKDQYHFDAPGMREMGKRYAVAFLKLASDNYVPRAGTVNTKNARVLVYQSLKSATKDIRIYSINGRVVSSYSTTTTGDPLRTLNAGGVYILSRKLHNGQTVLCPFVK